jgi:pyruvate/2-oxoglutarate dehydrogenase complex dihydrolipoamide dehydrogenase (E3) component
LVSLILTHEIIKGLLEQSENPKLFTKQCKFVDANRIAIGIAEDGEDKEADENTTAEKILIATGTMPFIPKIKALKNLATLPAMKHYGLKDNLEVLHLLVEDMLLVNLHIFLAA